MGEDMLLISNADINKLNISFKEVMKAVESVLGEHGKGQVEMPLKSGIHPKSNGFLHSMPAFVKGMNSAGIKWISVFPDNIKQNIPQITGIITLNDTETGRPLTMMDVHWITSVRTAAVTAVSAKYLARKNSETIGLVGAGNQGKYHVLMLNEVLPNLKRVKVYDIYDEAIEEFAKFIESKLDLEVIPAKSPKETTDDSDVIITATPRVAKPYMDYAWLKQGVFAVGLENGMAWGKATSQMNKFITDDWEQAKFNASENLFPGGLPKKYIEIGKVIVGERKGRENNEENIIACNVGLAINDIAVGRLVYEKAIEKNVGTWFSMG